jgi:hypothetical protein
MVYGVARMRRWFRTQISLRRVLSLTLTVLCLLVLTHAFSHSHAKGQSEASCQICQAARGQSIPLGQMPPDAAALTPIGYVLPLAVNFVEVVVPQYSASRAPPAL